jgi:hypothetical protein
MTLIKMTLLKIILLILTLLTSALLIMTLLITILLIMTDSFIQNLVIVVNEKLAS